MITPIEFYRSMDGYIGSFLDLNCTAGKNITKRWSVKVCDINCSRNVDLGSSIVTTSSELYLPALSVAIGTYEFTYTVIIGSSPSVVISASVFISIKKSAVVANLVPGGTSMITQASYQDLTLDPGSYSVDVDFTTFNRSVCYLGRRQRCSNATCLFYLELDLQILLSSC